MNEANRQLISLHSKQLKLPTFSHYDEIIRQLAGDKIYDDFLVALMQRELDHRQDGACKRKVHNAHFPYAKSLEEFDCNALEHVTEALIHQLASCDFIQRKQNLIMIGDPGAGKTHLSIALGYRRVCSG